MGIKTYANLNKKLNKLVKDNMKKITTFAYNEVVKNVYTYYAEYKPKSYERTFQFLNSPYVEKVQEIGGTYFSQVGIDYQNMNYWIDNKKDLKDEEGAGQLIARDEDPDTGFVFLEDGYRVVKAANEGDHGVEFIAKSTNNYFWDDALVVVWNDAVQNMFAREIRRKTGCDCQPVNGWLI